MSESASEFLIRYGMLDPGFDLIARAESMCSEMRKGLCGEQSSYPMIPTWLHAGAELPDDEPVAVIDAGGTNFRSGLVYFENGRCILERVRKAGMPGISAPASWEEFIKFTADAIEDLMPQTKKIGFCFSYSAEITPEVDGRVICIDKEVVINGCEGQLIGADLSRELARRGWPDRRVVVLNDTAAVQLGGMARHQGEGLEARFGQVSGTGTNTCCSVRGRDILKLGSQVPDMIINTESGMYDGLPQGVFDRELDRLSHNPGQKHFEKMTAGVYLGELCHLAARQAAMDKILSSGCRERILALKTVESALADAWAAGESLDELDADENDRAFLSGLARALFERSAVFMAANLTGMALLTGAGVEKPAAIYAEGSLVQRSHYYKPELLRQLDTHLRGTLGRDIRLVVEQDTTLPGAGAAALLN